MPLWGTDQIVGFVRFNGYPMGVVASDSRHVNGGALEDDAPHVTNSVLGIVVAHTSSLSQPLRVVNEQALVPKLTQPSS